MSMISKEFKYFEHKDKKIFYKLKDIELKEYRGKELASAHMMLYNENGDVLGSCAVYDERNKVLYAMPIDAKQWYEDFLKEAE